MTIKTKFVPYQKVKFKTNSTKPKECECCGQETYEKEEVEMEGTIVHITLHPTTGIEYGVAVKNSCTYLIKEEKLYV